MVIRVKQKNPLHPRNPSFLYQELANWRIYVIRIIRSIRGSVQFVSS